MVPHTGRPYPLPGGTKPIGGILQASVNAITNNTVALATSGNGTPMLSNSLGNNNTVTLLGAGAQLNLRADGINNTNFEIALFNNPIVVNASDTISVDRFSANGGTFKVLAVPSVSIGSQTLTVNVGDNYYFQSNSTSLTGLPTIVDNAQGIILNGHIT